MIVLDASALVELLLDTATGQLVAERIPAEVSTLGGRRVAPEEAAIGNAAFDVTPADLVTAFITDRGIVQPPYSFTGK